MGASCLYTVGNLYSHTRKGTLAGQLVRVVGWFGSWMGASGADCLALPYLYLSNKPDSTSRENNQMSTLATLVVAGRVLSRVGTTNGLTGAQMHVLAAVGILTATGGRPTYATLAQVVGHTDREHLNILRAVKVLAAAGYVSKVDNGVIGVRLEAAGQVLLDKLERTERRAVRELSQIKLGRWKRQYVRSGKYVGRAAKLKASKAAKQQQPE